MTRLRGPYSVAFPVNFTSRGDTTRDAFRKHMDEITRIYGILTGLDADTMDASAVSEILRNWRPSMSFSDISGNLDASRVSGALTGATIDGSKVTGTIAASKVSGIEALVKSLAPGITYSNLVNDGCVKFANSLLVQWGTFICQKDTSGCPIVNFKYRFEQECFFVSMLPVIDYAGLSSATGLSYDEILARKTTVILTLERGGLSNTSCRYHVHTYREGNADASGIVRPAQDSIEMNMFVNHIALGV